MNRPFASISVLALLFLAVAMCVRQTIEYADELGSGAMLLLTIEIIVAAALVGTAVLMLVRLRAKNGNKLSNRGAFQVAQPLRRLLSAVWS